MTYMRTQELFSATQSFSKVMREDEHLTYCIDNDSQFDNDLTADIFDIHSLICENLDVLWASVPCTTYSVASISKHWTGGKGKYIPKSEECKKGLQLLDHTIKLIAQDKPKVWFIENPRGVMRKVIDDIFKKYNITDYHRITIWYCQYGDSRAKPTDIFTNLKNWQGKQCKNNSISCNHERAPRGSRTGTQGLKNAKYRSVIPPKLFWELLPHIKSQIKGD